MNYKILVILLITALILTPFALAGDHDGTKPQDRDDWVCEQVDTTGDGIMDSLECCPPRGNGNCCTTTPL